MNKETILFFLKGNEKEFFKAHPEFEYASSNCKKYFVPGYKYALLLIKSTLNADDRKRWRFSLEHTRKLAYIAKLMELYAEGWISIEERHEDSKSYKYVSESEWKAILKMREGE